MANKKKNADTQSEQTESEHDNGHDPEAHEHPQNTEAGMRIVIFAQHKDNGVHVRADMTTANGMHYGAGQNAESGLDVMRAAKEIIELLVIQTHQQDVLDADACKVTQPDFHPMGFH